MLRADALHIHAVVADGAEFFLCRAEDLFPAALLPFLLGHAAPPSFALCSSPAHSKPFLAINTAMISLMTAAAATVPWIRAALSGAGPSSTERDRSIWIRQCR